MKCIIIIIILFTGIKNSSQAQQLASEKPVESFYSKATKQRLQTRDNDRQPAAQKPRQDLASGKAVAQPSVPAHIQPRKKSNQTQYWKAAQRKARTFAQCTRSKSRWASIFSTMKI